MITDEPKNRMCYSICVERYETPDELSFPNQQFYTETKECILEDEDVIERAKYLGTDSVVFFFQWMAEPKNGCDTEGRELYQFDVDVYVTFLNKADIVPVG